MFEYIFQTCYYEFTEGEIVMKKTVIALAILIFGVGVGFISGYRTTMLRQEIEVDKQNDCIYSTLYGQRDIYTLDYIER